MTTLFDPVRVGDMALANRIVMAPLTRDRAPHELPNDLTVKYYEQRATAGLIVSEGTQVAAEGQGYLDTPGLHTPEQVAAWKKVTDAVHARGGKIIVQLWHVGRISHVSLLPGGKPPVSSTSTAANTKTFTREGFVPVSQPRELTLAELPGVVEQFRHAARCAIDAGFDGVEVHGANGYLLEQFMRDSINKRGDAYGGSIENRGRLVVEIMSAIAKEIGAGRTGIRISPVTPANDADQDSDAQALFNYMVEQFSKLDLAFVHVVEGSTGGPRDDVKFDYEALRSRFKGAWIVNNGYTRQMALDVIAGGRADLVAFGRPFISNPDLVERLRQDLPLARMNSKTLYGGGAEGYVDYPTFDAQAA
ncbi:MAG: alkene reductase [Rhizobacter sp.]|nr:alkene reductase [Rhizobacter sp.]